MGPRLWDRPFGILGQTVWHIGCNFPRHPAYDEGAGAVSFQPVFAENPSGSDTGQKSAQMTEP